MVAHSVISLFRCHCHTSSPSVARLANSLLQTGLGIFVLLVFFLLPGFSCFSQNEQTAVENFMSGPFYDSGGHELTLIKVPGKPPAGYRSPAATLTPGAVIINDVPAYDWSFGCAPTAASMAAGYYDNTGYEDIYVGPTNGGLMPMDNTIWGTVVINGQTLSQCPISATRQGLDGRVSRGHADDYWNYYENGDPDPYIVNNWTQHPHDTCTGDFMGSNQSAYGNPDGASTFFLYTDGSPLSDFSLLEPNFRDGCHGLKLFYESRGYQIVENYSQMIMGYNGNTVGFTFDQYVEEIDNGRPVLIHIAGHTMLGYGYDEAGQMVFLHDTWDHSMHSMNWAGRYAGRQHFGVTVIRLQSDTPPPVALFTANHRQVDPGQIVEFTDASTGSPSSWLWTFEGGNPSFSTDQNPVITYEVPGIYPVTLIATNAIGYDSEIRNNYISVRHCFASGDCNDFITAVHTGDINNINNNCGDNGYSDFTAITAELVPGKQYAISILIDSIILPDEKCGLWLDWNRDNDFIDPGEFTEIPKISNTTQFSGSFDVPLGAPADSLFRMRVRIVKSGELTPCDFSGPGETEDYSVHLLKPMITVEPDYIDFGGVIRFDCSDPLPYTVSACNLSSPLFITASPDMQLSFYPDQGFTYSLSIPPVNDSIPETTVYVKFCFSWTTSEYEFVYNSCPGAATQIVTLHATEFIPPPANAPVLTAGNIVSIADTIIRIPVTVSDFENIQFGNLNLTYDPKVLLFAGIENIHTELDWWWIEGNEYLITEDLANLNLYLDGNENPRNIPDNEKLFDLVFNYAHGATDIGFDSTSCSWEDTWYHPMNDVPAENHYISGSAGPESVTIKLNLVLESLFDENQSSMRKAKGEYGDQFPGTVSDLVNIMLASPVAPFQVIDTIGAIPLYQDGSCKFYKPLSFNGNYYLLISHRNSIETWTAAPIIFSGDYVTYDFTDSASKAFGNNLKLVGNKYCFFAGDVNHDETIDSGDMTLIDNDATIFITGYVVTDLSGDGVVDTGDISILDNNSNSFISSKKP
ncbi:MAG: PKD domain-containing protein [Bacteroidales bacterium]|nr:PKD domain-containing protein [Bacteroidales bacterium]